MKIELTKPQDLVTYVSRIETSTILMLRISIARKVALGRGLISLIS